MNDFDLAWPATTQRTSNGRRRFGRRRIPYTFTSNLFTVTLQSRSCQPDRHEHVPSPVCTMEAVARDRQARSQSSRPRRNWRPWQCGVDGASENHRVEQRPAAESRERPRVIPTEQAALKCLYLAIMSLGPRRAAPRRWTKRWKAALNAFDSTFDGRLSAGRKAALSPERSMFQDLAPVLRRTRPGPQHLLPPGIWDGDAGCRPCGCLVNGIMPATGDHIVPLDRHDA